MKNYSINELKQLVEQDKITKDQFVALKKDTRKGVQNLLKKHEQTKQKQLDLKNKFFEMSQYERFSYEKGCEFIAGMDEAGRGPLAGPVVAAAVILPREFMLLGLDDSKRLNEQKRTEFYTIIKEQAISYGISIISNETIDEVNIYEATKLAMRDAINQLSPKPDHVLIDAVPLSGLACSSESMTKGDQKSISIAAASILAKVTRDNLMKKIHSTFPMYDFESNMGYGTKHHMQAIQEHGISPFHRKSFGPVKGSIVS